MAEIPTTGMPNPGGDRGIWDVKNNAKVLELIAGHNDHDGKIADNAAAIAGLAEGVIPELTDAGMAAVAESGGEFTAALTAQTETVVNPLIAEATADLAPKYYDDAGTYVDRGSIQTISRNIESPTNLQPTVWINVSSKGDNATFKGTTAGTFRAGDRTDVTALNKGVLYGIQSVVAPRVDRDNVPFDDVVGLSIENQGTGRGTDALYFGRNRADKGSNPTASDWSNMIQNDAKSANFIRSIGVHEVGISFSGATITTTAMRLGNAQTIAWMAGDGVTLKHALRLTAGNTLRLYEGGIDIRSDLGAYFGDRAVLANDKPLRAIKNGVSTETDLVRLTSADVLSLYAGALLLNSAGALAMKNNVGISARNAANTTDLEMVRLTGSDNLTLHGAKATLLAGGGMSLAPVSSIPSAPGAGTVVLYSDAGVLKAKTSSGTITTLAS